MNTSSTSTTPCFSASIATTKRDGDSSCVFTVIVVGSQVFPARQAAGDASLLWRHPPRDLPMDGDDSDDNEDDHGGCCDDADEDEDQNDDGDDDEDDARKTMLPAFLCTCLFTCLFTLSLPSSPLHDSSPSHAPTLPSSHCSASAWIR
eukprot:91611-Rhodomonas_salina.3